MFIPNLHQISSHPINSPSRRRKKKRRLSYTWFPWCWCVSALNRQMQMKQCMSMPLWGCEMGRSVLTHSCNHTHCGHPVYLAHPLALGCGISAHYWQLGISPGEHAFPMTNIPRAMGTHVCRSVCTKQHSLPQCRACWVLEFCWDAPEGPYWPSEAIWDNTFLDPYFWTALGKIRMANIPLPQYQMLR